MMIRVPIYNKLDSLSKLSPMDLMFIRALRTTFNEECFFKSVSVDNLGFIIKISKENKYFNSLCQQDKYKKLWDIVYSIVGLHLTASDETPVSFYVHDNPNLDSFSLAKGAYLFYISDLLRNETRTDYTRTEINLLTEAMVLKSIHATQRYNQFLFHKIEHNQLGAVDN